MADFFTTLQQRIEKHVNKNAFESGQCWEWKGARKSPDGKYGRMKLTVDGARKSIGAHRAAYMAFYRETYLGMDKDVSHVCHQPLCVNPDHLSLEDRVINMERHTCKLQGSCSGHSFKGQVLKPCLM